MDARCTFKLPDAPYTEDFMQRSKSFMIYKDSRKPKQDLDEILPKKGREMVDTGYITELCNLLASFPDRKDTADEDVQHDMLEIPLVYSSRSSSVFKCLCQQTRFLDSLLQYLEKWCEAHSDKRSEFTAEEEKLLEIAMKFIKSDNEKLILAVTEFLLKFLRTEDKIRDLLRKEPKIKQSMASMMDKTMEHRSSGQDYKPKSPQHKATPQFPPRRESDERSEMEHQWTINRFLHFLEQIVTADEIKSLFVVNQRLANVVDLLKKKDRLTTAEDLVAVLEVILQLSFIEDIRTKMVKDKNLIHRVNDLYTKPERAKGTKHQENAIRSKCGAILWLLEEELLASDSEKFRKIGTQMGKLKGASSAQKEKSGSTGEGDIMISYQSDNQDMVKRICEKLKAEGLKVWINENHAGGCLLQIMAKAVEGCHTFLLAASQQYKDSANCRLEAGYASECEKRIVPLLMEGDYKPDGWLGLLTNYRSSYDFSPEADFEFSIQKLVDMLKRRRGNTEQVDSATKNKVRPAQNSDSLREVKNWTEQRVYKWLTPYKLQIISSLNCLEGKELVFLHYLYHQSGDSFYRCLTSNLHLNKIKVMASFTDAIESLNTEPDRNDSSRRKKKERSVRNWGKMDIQKWLKPYGLDQKASLRSLDGNVIEFLENMKLKAPDSFSHIMKKLYQIKTSREMEQVRTAFDNLP